MDQTTFYAIYAWVKEKRPIIASLDSLTAGDFYGTMNVHSPGFFVWLLSIQTGILQFQIDFYV